MCEFSVQAFGIYSLLHTKNLTNSSFIIIIHVAGLKTLLLKKTILCQMYIVRAWLLFVRNQCYAALSAFLSLASSTFTPFLITSSRNFFCKLFLRRCFSMLLTICHIHHTFYGYYSALFLSRSFRTPFQHFHFHCLLSFSMVQQHPAP